MLDDYIRDLRKFFTLYFVRPVILLCGGLISSFYNVFFARWLEGLTSNGLRRRLEREIRQEQSWLFEKYEARIVPKTKSHGQVLDYASVQVHVGNLILNFIRGLGECYVNVAPAHASHDWYRFGEAIELASDKKMGSAARFDRMSEFRSSFETHFGRLNMFFSQEKYGQPRRDRSVGLVRL